MHRQQTPRVPPPPPPQPPQHLHILNQQQQQQQQQQHQQSPTILQRSVEASVQLLTESIATDITRLQSLQVVSNLLQDDFRNELENLVQVTNNDYLVSLHHTKDSLCGQHQSYNTRFVSIILTQL